MNAPSRRRFLHTAALTAVAAHLTPHTLLAQAPTAQTPPSQLPPKDRLEQLRASAASAKINTQPLRGNVSTLLGSGGNIAVLTGKDGLLLVDSSFRTSQPQIRAALNAISPGPITHLINTHWHTDHTDGNPWMHAAGATIIAHQNCKTRLSSTQHIDFYNMTVPPLPPGGIPTQTFTQDHSLQLNGETLALAHYAPAHTDTDTSIYFPNADILHTGDTWFNSLYPFIDYSSGGSIDGMILAAQTNLALTTDKTILIPGHGPVGNRAQLLLYTEMLSGTRNTVARLKQQGRSLPDIIAAKPTAPFDSAFKPSAPPVDNFIRLIYQGV